MVDYIKNHRLALLLVGTVFLTILRVAIPFYSGYFGSLLYLILLCTEGIRYILIVSCAIVILTSKLNRKSKLLISIPLAFLILITFIPTGLYMTGGALASIYQSNPTQFRNDARAVLDEYEPMTCFSNQVQRTPCNEPIPRNKLPASLLSANIGDVLVLDDYVFLEKFGLLGLFRGFVVFREGADVWINEKSVALLDGCNYCLRIRVIDGLYWYHAVPTEEERSTFTFPLK